MQTNRQSLQDAAIEVGITDCPDGLSDIHRSGVAEVTWRRQLIPDFQDWINHLDPDALPRACMILQPHAVRDAVEAVCDGSGVPHGPDRGCLIDHIAALSDMFAELMSAPYLMLRVDVIANDACSKFHIDKVAQLVCTYRGTGPRNVILTDEADLPQVSTMPTGDSVLLREKLWPDRLSSGLLHCSPPTEETEETLPVLALDPVPDPEEVH